MVRTARVSRPIARRRQSRGIAASRQHSPTRPSPRRLLVRRLLSLPRRTASDLRPARRGQHVTGWAASSLSSRGSGRRVSGRRPLWSHMAAPWDCKQRLARCRRYRPYSCESSGDLLGRLCNGSIDVIEAMVAVSWSRCLHWRSGRLVSAIEKSRPLPLRLTAVDRLS